MPGPQKSQSTKMARFATSTKASVDFFLEKATAKNTKLSTNTWVNCYNDWAKERGFRKEIFEYPPHELDTILQTFYVEVRKSDGQEYEPQCLNVMITSLDRYLKQNGYKKSIVRDTEFKMSKTILEGVARDLRTKGKGRCENRSHSLSPEEEEILWQCGQFGFESPRALLHTVWWFIGHHFGLRGRSEHHNLKIEDFQLSVDSKNRKYMTFAESLTKNHNGGLHFKGRRVEPKMYESIGFARCPLACFFKYKERRPHILKDCGPLYLSVIDHPKSNVWYSNSPMGINTIDNIMKKLISKSPLAGCKRKITNHSARKTSIRKMKAAGFVNSQIKTVTGHKHEQSLDSYLSGDDDEMNSLSNAISNYPEPEPLLPEANIQAFPPIVPVPLTSTATGPAVASVQGFRPILPATPTSNMLAQLSSMQARQCELMNKSFERNFSFGFSYMNSVAGGRNPYNGENVYVFNHCKNVTITSGEVTKKRRRINLISDSSDDDSQS